ncbi:MAG TPA: phosphoribosylglycinamide formyltransferase, partial [Acidimicrobiales bacterium]|nr:phosphoribosylglycinamide formyltransferase [Acidimicrobiales bacterium]
GTVAHVRVGVLASGSGTILEAILAAGVPVEVVVVDRPCRAQTLHPSAVLLERTDFSKGFDRDGYTDDLIAVLREHDVELVVMAGFGTIVPKLAAAYPDRFLNTHPALLPSFKGWHAVRDALAFGVKVTGCTVHLATEELDEGPILAQEAVPVLAGDTEETLQERIKAVERRLYPETIKKFIAGELP